MVALNSNERERLSVRQKGPETEKKDDKESAQVREHSQEMAQGIEGIVEGVESGEVSEKSSEGRQKASAGSIKSSTQTQTSTSRAATDEPPFEVMVIQIRTHLKQEIAVLQKEAKKYVKGSEFSPYKFAEIMAKIRRLREILSELVSAAGEKVRDWWKEYVKGAR